MWLESLFFQFDRKYNPGGSLCYEPVTFSRNGAQYGSNRSMLSLNQAPLPQQRNGPMRGSTRSFSSLNFPMGSQNMYQQQPAAYNRSAYEFHQVGNQQQQQQQQQQQRANQLSGRCGTGSVTSLHSLQSDVYQMVERPSRPNSVQQMMPNGQYQVVQPRQGQLQSASMSSLNTFGPQLNQLQTAMHNAVQRNQGANPQELATAMRKMEECLQVFAQLSGAPSPSPQKMMQAANQTQQQQQQQQQEPQQRVLSPSNPSRSQNLLQPQPEFQKREQMKKRRQRRKSDISKVDLTELRRKLESIDVSDGSDSGESDIKNKSERPKAAGSPISDGGFYDAGSGSDSGSKVVDQDRTSVMSGYISTGSSGSSSDSGVVTPPPPQTAADQEAAQASIESTNTTSVDTISIEPKKKLKKKDSKKKEKEVQRAQSFSSEKPLLSSIKTLKDNAAEITA